MRLFDMFRRDKKIKKRSIVLANGEDFAEFIKGGYRPLSSCPEVIAACNTIAQMIASMTIYLMANTEKGDIRISNELSRKIDINPNEYMTRNAWMTAIVMNLLLYGEGNSIVFPHTQNGYLGNLEPIEAERVSFMELVGGQGYRIVIDGKKYKPDELLHFTINPDPHHLWKGQGFSVPLKPLVDNLSQAAETERAFFSSKWKPSVVVKVDALTEEFSSPEGRRKLLDSYIRTSKAGEPWLIPADQFAVEQIRPLSLSDLAINESVQIDKRTVAAILGVPPFVLGVGDYDASAWDSFVNTKIMYIAQGIEQEMTRKLILSPKMYLKFNASKLYSYDLQKAAQVYGNLYDKGVVTGNEVRDKIGMEPRDGLDELIVLENYIKVTDIGKQKKLNGGEGDD